MPFKTETTFPERSPDVQIFFHGLLMLIPDEDGNQCRIGVHRLSVQHKLSVEVRVKGNEPPDPPLLRLGGSLDSLGLTIKVLPETTAGVKKFVTSEGAFDRFEATNHPKDFRWCVDMQTLDPSQVKLELSDEGIDPSILITDGLFHAARLTDPDFLEVALTNPGNPVTPLNRLARLIGANIYLDPGQKVELKWFGDGGIRRLDLPRTDENHTALIYIDNSPSLMPDGKPDHSEFVEYAKVLTNASLATRRFDVDFNVLEEASMGTDKAPCMSVVVGG